MRAFFLAVVLVSCFVAPLHAHADELEQSLSQLRHAIGKWDVVTTFIDADGKETRRVSGTYEFSWVIPDRVVAGRSVLHDPERTAALLFYIDEAEREIEMVSVGADGHLWVMSGPLGSETRYSQTFETDDGSTAQLRFTRFNVSPDRFESRMQISRDGGATWRAGNHQLFVRASTQ